MGKEQILPTILIVIDIGAAIAYAMNGDLRKCVYWISAAVLTACVTY